MHGPLGARRFRFFFFSVCAPRPRMAAVDAAANGFPERLTAPAAECVIAPPQDGEELPSKADIQLSCRSLQQAGRHRPSRFLLVLPQDNERTRIEPGRTFSMLF